MLCHFEMKEALQGWYPISGLTVATVLPTRHENMHSMTDIGSRVQQISCFDF